MKWTTISIVVFLVILPSHLLAEEPPLLDYKQVYWEGESGWGSAVAVSQAGEVYVVGGVNGNNILIKYNSSGEILWTVTDPGSNVAVDKEGNVLTAGSLWLPQVYGYNIQITKYNPSGNTIWRTTYSSGRNWDIASSLAIDDNENIYVADCSVATQVTLKYDTNGTLLWQREHPGAQGNMSCGYGSVGVDKEGNVYAPGVINSGKGTSAYVYVVKYDSLGNTVWDTTYGSEVGASPAGTAVDGEGNIYLYTYLGYELQLVKISSAGNILWSKNTGGFSGWSVGITTDKIGYIYVAPQRYLKKYDSSGNLVWTVDHDTYDEYGRLLTITGIAVDITGNIYGTGGTVNPNLFLLKYKPQNHQPIANAGPDQTIECSGHSGTQVTLNGSGSSDPDGDTLTYKWTWRNGSATGVNPTITLPLGTYDITLVVNDGKVDSAPDTVAITIRDTTPPIINLSLNPTLLWPPNHKYVPIVQTVAVTDICDASPIYSYTVSSNEPDDAIGLGDGNTINDVLINGNNLSLRAERDGNGAGRIYTITYTVVDISGNATTQSAQVVVPHDQK